MWLQRRKDKKLAMGVAVAMGMGTEGSFSSVKGLPAQASPFMEGGPFRERSLEKARGGGSPGVP